MLIWKESLEEIPIVSSAPVRKMSFRMPENSFLLDNVLITQIFLLTELTNFYAF
jgi:hypothetical protein